ncbi:hypothetical protein GCM10007937_18160 [Mesorhizobium albiziae]|nr:hypothetical protein GCM10007937_18160 [Mesorhizobium albiziae]
MLGAIFTTINRTPGAAAATPPVCFAGRREIAAIPASFQLGFLAPAKREGGLRSKPERGLCMPEGSEGN